MIRGVERRAIFIDDDDRHQFLQRFGRLLLETGTDCYAWALLPNHAHMLLRCRDIELSRFMRRLLTGYAVYFNRRHDRVGHLFQNRYKSIVCEEDTYFLELIRYIHLNPLRAGLVSDLQDLDDFKWCGHAALVGRESLRWYPVDELLRWFSADVLGARRVYRQFVADGLTQGNCPERVGDRGPLPATEVGSSSDHRVLGSDAFVARLRSDERFQARLPNPQRLSLDELRSRVAAMFALPVDAIMWRRRGNSAAEARGLFCFLAVKELGYSGVAVGGYLRLDGSSVSRAVSRGDVYRRKHLDGTAMATLLNH
jgi:REP element-mobilizing transposase RayT